MADVVTPERTAPRSAPVERSPRAVRRTRPLPTGRAVVGGFLVTVSAVGIFAAYSRAAAGPTTEFVVATRDVPVGSRLTAADVTTLPMELPEVMREEAAFRRAGAVVGATTVGPIRRGELVQAGDLVQKRSATDELEVSFALESARALAGSLQAGERVDVLATFGTGGDSYTVAVVRQARVLEVRRGSGSLAGGDTDVIRLAVASSADALAVTHALHAGDVTLARTTGVAGSAPPGETYRAPAAGGER